MISNTTSVKMYQDLGISREVYSFCQEILTGLEPRFKEIDENAEYNQLKVLCTFINNWFIVPKGPLSIYFHTFRHFQTTV